MTDQESHLRVCCHVIARGNYYDKMLRNIT